ncbi:MAG: hypothetical protein HY868_05280 [Chloroflexi bacterium]|nr:hypothetical protein [Chloroflexota bacterium]
MNHTSPTQGELDPLLEPHDHCNAWDGSALGQPARDTREQDARAGKLDPSRQPRDCANAWDTSALY